MANTRSAKKAVRSSSKKRSHNLLWKNRFRSAVKALYKAISEKESENVIAEKYKVLQKALDKASKEIVIHKNKANRVKSRYAKRISALLKGEDKPKVKTPKAKTKQK